MKAIKTTELEGDLAQGRNITAGGDITAQGSGVVGKNLTVKGWLKARNIIGACKGLFASEERLNSEYPNPHNGWWAMVGNTIPAAIYEADYGAWVATGETGGNPVAEIDDLDTLRSTVDELVTYLAIGILVPDSVKATSDATSMKLTFSLQLPDNTTQSYTVSYPMASTTAAGAMSAEDKQNLAAVITKAASNSDLITSLQTQINTLTGSNASEAIENFNEVIAFLSGVTDDETLTALLTELSKKISANTTTIEGHTATLNETGTMRFDGIVSGVSQQQMSVIAIDGIYYDDESKVFVAKNGDGYYSNWKTDSSNADMYMNSNRTAVLKNKVYLCNDTMYVWSDNANGLVSVNTEELIGAANGVAPLDENGQVPTSNLPVDICNVIVVNYWDVSPINVNGAYSYSSSAASLKKCENGKWSDVALRTDVIYVDKDNSVPYIWDGTAMVAIAPKDTPASIYNVNVALNTPTTYYKIVDNDTQSQSAAHVSWEQGVAVSGLILSFKIGQALWKTYQYVGTEVTQAKWTDESNWQDFGSLAAGSETYIIIDNLVGSPAVGTYYTLETAVQALLSYQTTSGVTYAKKGLIISYCTGENTMETKQFQGEITDIGQVGLWKDFGGGSKVETKDTPEENGTDALSTGGAYTAIPTDLKVDTETEGVVKISMVNAKGDTVGNEQQFSVGTGSGESSGTIVIIIPETSPIYGQAGGTIILNASIRSVTSQSGTELTNIIERVELYDRDTNQLLATYKVNQASSADAATFDFSFDLSSYFAQAGARKFKLIAYDDSDHSGSRNVNATAVDVTISSVQTLNYTAATVVTKGGTTKNLPMYRFANNASDKGILCTTEIYIDSEWKTLGTATISDTYSHSVSINPNNCAGEVLQHGAYPLRIHGVDIASGVVGNYLHTAVMVVEADNTTPIVATRWLSENETAELKQYETISMDIAAYNPNAQSIEVDVIEVCGGTSTVKQTLTAYRTSTYTYTQRIQGYATDGSVTITLVAKAGTGVSQTADFKVKDTLLDIESVTAQLMVDIDLSTRSNSDADKSITYGDYTLNVTGANYSTNGFVKDSYGTAEYGTEADTGVMALRIAENVKASLDYKPFNVSAIETNGMALQFRIRTRHVADDDARLMSCISDGFGFYVTGKNVVFTFDNAATVAHTITAALKDDTITDVAIVIEPSSQAPYSGIGVAKMYFDGELIGACYYNTGTIGKHAMPISFDGTYGDLYLYNIRAWETYYGFEQAFNNYLLKLADTDSMVTEYEYNQVMASQAAEGKAATNRPQAASLYALGIPYFVVCKNPNTADTTDNYPDYLETLDGDKKTKRYYDIYAYFPDRPWQDFKAENVPTTNQGTTSSKRPIKNIKMKFKGCTITLLHDASEFSGEDLEKYNECLANAAKSRVQPTEDSLPTNIITVKVDYSESGGANNGASTQLYNELQRALGSNYMTPAQNAYTGKYTLNTSIDSIPCAFFRTDPNSDDATSPSYGYFHAKGNWNDDKGDAAVFGFEKVDGYNADCLNYGDFIELIAARDQSLDDYDATLDKTTWDTAEVYVLSEFCGPNHKVYRYQDGAWTETTGTMTYTGGKWRVEGDVVNPVENYELLVYNGMDWFQGVNTIDDMLAPKSDADSTPCWLTYFESRYPDNDDLNAAYEDGRKVPYQLFKWLQWCQQCNQNLTADDGNITLDGTTVSGTKANRLLKFKHELHNVANVHSMICYHVFTDYVAAVDQRSKNMMVGFYLDTDGVVRMYLNHLYDGDTILGSDNDCGLTIPAKLDPNNDPNGYYQGHDSVLFTQLANSDYIWIADYTADTDTSDTTKTTTVAAIAATMRSVQISSGLRPFSPDGITKYWITDRLQKWPKLVSSYDGIRKYIENSKSTANYFYALHGLSIQRLQDYVETRFLYRDGFYQCGDVFSSMAGMRCTGTDMTVTIKAAKEGYFGIGVDRANEARESVYLEEGETATLHTDNTNTGSGVMLYIFGAENVAELDLSNATPKQSAWDISAMTLLKKLVLGGENYTPATSTGEELSTLSLGQMPFLEEIDARNFPLKSIDASYCPRLKSVLAGGTSLQSFTPAETAPIETLELPSTMTNANFVNLPNLTYPGGLTFESLANITRVFLSGSPNIDAEQLLGDIVDAGATVKYVRVAGVNMTSSYKMLQSIMDDAAIGLDENGTAIEETGQCSGITGRWILRELVEDSKLTELQKYFPELTIYNSQFSCVVFDDTAEDTANISNLDNETGYAYGNTFVESGHWAKIKANCHIYKTVYDSTNKKLKLTRMSDSAYTELADGTSFDPTDQSGVGYDIMKLLCHYWYKGVNDFKNQQKYLYGSYQTAEPLSTRNNIVRKTLSDIKVKAYSALLTDSITVGDTYGSSLLSDNSNMNTYCIDVENMKQVRWPGVNNASLCAVFVDASGTILSTFTMAVSHSLFDFVLGDYVFTDVPSGATKFYFTSPIGFDDEEAIAVDSSEIEAIEPDWVEQKQSDDNSTLIGVYGLSVDNLSRARSISGQKTKVGTGTSTTNTDWSYDSDGKLTNSSVPTSTMNYTCQDFLNICKMRGDGFQAIDYEMSKDIANLYMATTGERDEQTLVGYGVGASYTSGGFDSIGNTNSVRGSSNNGNKILGLENFVACNYEWMDNVAVNIDSWTAWEKAKRVAQSDWTINQKWHIYDPISKTERTVQGINNSGYCIARVKFGRYADTIASRLSSDNSKWNKNYGDGYWYSNDRGRVVGRAFYNANAYGGLVSANAYNVSSLSYTHSGSRLAFRGAIEIVAA